jgi:hypothetical protein
MSSSKLEIVDVKSFKDARRTMNEEAEEMYNTSLSLSSSKSGKENYLPQRIPQRSKYFCSPFYVNSSASVIVQPIEQRIWEAVTALCDIEPGNL